MRPMNSFGRPVEVESPSIEPTRNSEVTPMSTVTVTSRRMHAIRLVEGVSSFSSVAAVATADSTSAGRVDAVDVGDARVVDDSTDGASSKCGSSEPELIRLDRLYRTDLGTCVPSLSS